ncbi:MAG: hypothetical protein GY810_31860 [Aureispira sp.]|nr:hypothetical protein [Aureispira sp.]
MKNYLFVLLTLSIFLGSCGSEEKPFIKFPPDDLAKDMSAVKNFSIILYDMDVTEDDKYKHQYKIITRTKDPEAATAEEIAAAQGDSTVTDENTGSAADLGMEEKLTEWKEVSEADFEFHSSDMGMEIYSKVDGELSKVAAPPGYSQYVGNEKYGQWKTDNSGNSTWAFFGRYMFISTMFHMMMPTPYGYYRGYGSYRGRTPYYGPKGAAGGHAYGTNSKHANGMNSKYASRASSNSKLKNKVNNSINKSSSRATGGKRTASTKQSRSSSRYSGSSKSRSSSFGGK